VQIFHGHEEKRWRSFPVLVPKKHAKVSEGQNSSFNLSQDMEFAKSREVLLAKKRELVEKHAKGNRPQAARSITPSVVSHLGKAVR